MPDRDLIVAERSFNRLVIAAVAIGFGLLAISAVVAARMTALTQYHTRWVGHTYQVQSAINDFYGEVLRVDAARRGLLITDEPRIRQAYAESAAGVPQGLAAIAESVNDNPVQQRNLATLRTLTERHLAAVNTSYRRAVGGEKAAAQADFLRDGSLDLILQVRAQVQRMLGEEQRLLREREAAQALSIRRFYTSLAVAGVLLLLVAGSSIFVILRYTRDLTASRDALQKLNNNLEGAVRERTTDLQRANDEIQRFAYIVSHDLRSPLVNVMGFTAELEASTKSLAKLVDKVEEVVPDKLDPDARDAARRDLPEAIGFIRTSTQKMDRLINAILRLSREGRRPITPERVQMRPLIQGIVDSMKHRTDELGIEISVADRLPDIVSDRLAVEQIFSNLIENATKYLKKDVPGIIQVRGGIEAKRAVFEVADNGRGVDPKDHERIFDLFRRSGVQDQPGEGIGLAHTRALAYRLGGTITVDSKLGDGATFRVSLPVTFSGEQKATT